MAIEEVIRPIEMFYDEHRDGDDWSCAMERAQNSMVVAADGSSADATRGSRGFTVCFQAKTYNFSRPIVLRRAMSLLGTGAAGWYAGTRLHFPRSDGIVCIFDATGCRRQDEACYGSGNPVPPLPAGGGRSPWTLIERLSVWGGDNGRQQLGPDGSVRHGIYTNARIKLRDVIVSDFSGDGVHITSEPNLPAGSPIGRLCPSPLPADASAWLIDQLALVRIGGHGLYIFGDDSNAGVAIAVDARYIGKWAIRDESFLGCTFIGCMVHQDGEPFTEETGSYWSARRTGSPPPDLKFVGPGSTFVGCYNEGQALDRPDRSWRTCILAPSMVVGGILGSAIGHGADIPEITAGGHAKPYPGCLIGSSGNVVNFQYGAYANAPATSLPPPSDRPAPRVAADLGGRSALTLHAGIRDGSHRYLLEYGRIARGWWSFINFAPPDPARPAAFAFSTNDASENGSQFWLPNGTYLGSGDSRIRLVTSDRRPPAPGVPQLPGTRCFNTRARPGDFEGWICMPDGTWRGYGLIEALPGDPA